jgi:hypothetical protein
MYIIIYIIFVHLFIYTNVTTIRNNLDKLDPNPIQYPIQLSSRSHKVIVSRGYVETSWHIRFQTIKIKGYIIGII